MSTTQSLTWAVVVLAATASAAHAQDGSWQIGSTPSFSTGRYGTDTRTEIVYTPLTARKLFSDGDLTLVVPFLCITGDGGVTVVNGTPLRQQVRPRAAATPGGRGGSDVRAGAATAPAPVERQCGIGDLVVRGRYYVLDERGWLPTIALRAHIKAPTADDERGLGTGRPDEGGGVEISRRLGGGVTAMLDGGYTLIGKPDGVRLTNAWWYDAGIGKDLSNGAVNLSLFYEEYSAIVPGLPSARDVMAAVMLQGKSGWRLQAGVQAGLSEGAPDAGFILGASRKF